MMFRVGIGYDIHARKRGDHIILGGVRLPCSFSLKGHSDADVLLHALTDSILGALGENDIGYHFPDSDIQNKNRNSRDFLEFTSKIMTRKEFSLVNADMNLICEEPKIKDHRQAIEESIANILKVDPSCINLKGKTNEKLDALGEGRAVAAQVVVLIQKF